MKPFVVFPFHEGLLQDFVVAPPNGRNFIGYVPTSYSFPSLAGRSYTETNIYFADNELHAREMAGALAKKYPGVQWTVAGVQFVMITIPPTTINTAKFSDKGLLPL